MTLGISSKNKIMLGCTYLACNSSKFHNRPKVCWNYLKKPLSSQYCIHTGSLKAAWPWVYYKLPSPHIQPTVYSVGFWLSQLYSNCPICNTNIIPVPHFALCNHNN